MYKKNNFIFNESINQCMFANLVKTAKFRPVYKKGNSEKLVIIEFYLFYPYFQNSL
jgi:hypothetical protein